jgi:hypothetical protein
MGIIMEEALNKLKPTKLSRLAWGLMIAGHTAVWLTTIVTLCFF